MGPAVAPPQLAVVTGATGHIGANLVRALLDTGRPVRVLTHTSTRGLEGLAVERVRGSVLDTASLRRAFDGAAAVFNCAGVISVDGDRSGRVHAVNVEGARNVAWACAEARVARLIHISSIQAYARNVGATHDERSALALAPTHFAYDRSKALGEQAVKAVPKLDSVVLNPAAVIGPHDYQPSRMGQLVLDLARGRLPATVNGGCNFVDARDVAKAALVAEERGRRGNSYILGGSWHGLRELATRIESMTGTRRPRLHCPMWLARLAAPFATSYAHLRGAEAVYTAQALAALRSHHHLSDARARQELGHAPRPFEQSVADTLDWFIAAGLLAPTPSTSGRAPEPGASW